MAAFSMARWFVSDGFKGVAEKLEQESPPDVKFNSAVPLPLDEEASHNLCSNRSMKIIEMQPNNGCVPSTPSLFVNSSLEINKHVVEPSPSLGAHETSHTSSLTAPLNTIVSKETEISAYSGSTSQDANEVSKSPELPFRPHAGVEVNAYPVPSPVHLSKFNASEQGAWGAAISYEACVRLCLHAWANHCSTEVCCFLENECALLRDAFGLQNVLLQSEAELWTKGSSKLSTESAAPNPVKTSSKIKLQVRKVKLGSDEPPASCSFSCQKQPKINKGSIGRNVSNLGSSFYPRLKSVWKNLTPLAPANASFRQSLDNIQARAKRIKKVPQLLKAATSTLCNASSSSHETYSCLLRLRSSPEEDAVRMQPGSGEAHFFFPDSLTDDLIIAVQDSKGQHCGHARAQVSVIADKPGDKLQWWPIYTDLELEPIGRIQLCMEYSTNPDENNHLKFGSISETGAYDYVFDAAIKFQQFQQRNFLIDGSWSWLLTEFGAYFGISEAYTKLRHLSYIMDVATPTEDCLTIVHDMLSSDILMMKGKSKNQLTPLENRMLVKIVDQVDQTLALVFENYKSLEEDSPSGMMDVSKPATGLASPALAPAFQLYSLLHDVLSSEAQMKFCRYFQVAAKKRLRVHFSETDNLILSSNEGTKKDPVTSYQKWKSLVSSIRNEILTDISIQDQNILPSFVDLPNISSSIYSVELCSRLRAFLVACPPPGLSLPVAELIVSTAEFQRDLSIWNINPVVGGVDAKELFDSHIISWIRNKRCSLLDRCKLDKVIFPYDLFVKLYSYNNVDLCPFGLTNCGNSCYANAVLQCLAFTQPLTSYLLQGLHSRACTKNDWCFICEFEILLQKAREGKSLLSPIKILSKIHKIGSHLGHGKEEDAHEFLRYAVDTMQSVCLKVAEAVGPLAEQTTLVGMTFGGHLRSKIKCMKCFGKTEQFERMMDLTVEIDGEIGTLEEALAQFTATETLEGDNRFHCNRCKCYEKARKKLTVLEAPNILTIVLKRFQSHNFEKLDKSVRFPEVLNLSPYMDRTSDKSPMYNLYAVVVHLDIMNAAYSGHYVCYVKNSQGNWFKIDDSSVEPVELKRVLSERAYMLLYARRSPRPPPLVGSNALSHAGIFKRRNLEAVPSSLTVPSTNSSAVQPKSGRDRYRMSFDGFSNQPLDAGDWISHSMYRAPTMDSSSENSSIFSSSDASSCSTVSTKDSSSNEDFSDYIFGPVGTNAYSQYRCSSDVSAPSLDVGNSTILCSDRSRHRRKSTSD